MSDDRIQEAEDPRLDEATMQQIDHVMAVYDEIYVRILEEHVEGGLDEERRVAYDTTAMQVAAILTTKVV